MVLTLDLGNTNLYLGVFKDNKLIATYRTYSDKQKSSDGYKEIINTFLIQAGLNKKDFKGAILSSVIPSLSRDIINAVEKLIDIKCLLVSQKVKSGLSIKIDNPSELGADLVCDSVGANVIYGYPSIIIDLGTATKYLVIDKNANFIGCVINSGIKLSFDSLAKNAAMLMEIDYEAPKKIVGKNSRDSLNSGAIYGTIAQIKELTKMIEIEVGYPLKRIITGGNANLIKGMLDDSFIFDDNLILKGLYEIYSRHNRTLK